MLGDNAYNSGTDAEYTTHFFDLFHPILKNSVVWPVLGNHDIAAAGFDRNAEIGAYYTAFSLPKLGEAGGVASSAESYYSYDYGNVHFVVLDSNYPTLVRVGSAQYSWLMNDLAATAATGKADWVIVYFHHPPYSKGSHDSDAESWSTKMRTDILPLLESAGVDLVLSGHSHSYERSSLLNGHYGLSSSFVSAYIVDGGNGDPAGSGPYRKPTPGMAANEGTVYQVSGIS